MKKKLKESNFASGLAVRGLGNVTGEPAIDDEDVSGYISNNVAYTDQLKDNMTNGLYGIMDDNWWMNRKDMKTYANKTKVSQIKEGMEPDHYKAIDDVHVNLENRNHAIEDYGYGPMNPNESSNDFWKQKAKLWKNTVEEAKKSRCGNCAAFNQSKAIMDRMAKNLGPAGKTIVEKSNLGFCEMFHFKCAGARTCDAWLMNGPITEQEGGSAVAGGGTTTAGIAGLTGDPPVSVAAQMRHTKRNKKDKMATRMPPVMVAEEEETIPPLDTGMFAGNKTFKVSPDLFDMARNERAKGKHWRKYLQDSPHYKQIRDHHRKNPKDPIIFENDKTGHMFYAFYGKKR